MIPKAFYNVRFFLIVLLYGALVFTWNLNYSSVTHDEAFNIVMGQQVLKGSPDLRNIGGMQAGETVSVVREKGFPLHSGSLMIQPVLAAIGDSVAGLPGARIIGVFFGLGLTVVIYMIVRTLCSRSLALLGSMLFLCTGTTLYLSVQATFEIVSAFFLGLGFLLLLLSSHQKSVHTGVMLFAGATALFVATITKYIAGIFIIPFLFYVFWRHKMLRAMLFFFLPLATFMSFYLFFPSAYAWGDFLGILTPPLQENRIPMDILTAHIYQVLAMPYLLAVFGVFHREWGNRMGILLILLSLPVILIHVLSGEESGLDRNVIYSIIFLTPAAALGVEHMGALFSMNSQTPLVKPFFIIAILLVVWAFGIYEFRWLEQQSPDMTEVTSFFEVKGFDGMTVVIDSVNREPEYLYRYSLGQRYPGAQFSSLQRVKREERIGIIGKAKPDFIVFEELIGRKSFRETALKHIKEEYAFVKDIKVPLSWGIQDIQIYKRR
jgi:hypothetical protein